MSTSRTRLATIALAVVVVGGAAYLFLGGDDGGAPPQWDPAVADLVTFVETQRGAAFTATVGIDVVDDAEFARLVGVGSDGPSPEDRARVELTLDLLTALALVDDEVDDALIAQIATEVLDGGRFAVYRPDVRRIVVRGESLAALDIVAQTELVGALSIALHDQYFVVSRASRLDRTSAVVGSRAVTEGAGAELAERFIAEQSEADQEAWREHQVPGSGDSAVDVASVMALIPDLLGPPLISVALADTIVDESEPTWDRVNGLFTNFPRTELELLQPWAALDGFERVGVAEPVPGAGEEVLASGDFGAASLYFVTAMRADPREALAAGLAWAGDAHILTRDADGRLCLTVAVVGRDGDASDIFESTLEAWVAAGPSDADASVSRDGRVVTLRSCSADSGAPTGIAVDPATVMRVPVSRTELLAELRAGGATRENAVCVADLVLAGIPVASLTDVEQSPESIALYEQLFEDAQASCRRL